MAKKNNMVIAEKGVVEQILKISDDIWDMTIYAPRIAELCRAGQFVHVRVNDSFAPFLRRPLSIGPTWGEYFRLIFLVKGTGTKILAQKETGNEIDLIGPLGKPFQLPEPDQSPILVAGGIGAVPLLLLDDQIPSQQNRDFLLGIRSEKNITVDEIEMERRGITVSSDDGSIGFHGTVVELLEKRLEEKGEKNQVVYGCGPGPMLQALKNLCLAKSVPAFISLEVPMGCGIGACQSCAVPKADGSGYYLVCQDGPVFESTVVDLNPESLP